MPVAINQNINITDIRLCDFDQEVLMVSKYAYYDRIGYEPFPEQDLFHRSMARYKVLACGTRFGKSLAAAREVEPYLMLPAPILVWIVAPTYQLGEKEFRYIWNDMIVNLGIKAKRKNYNVNSGSMYIEFEHGPKVYVKSLIRPHDLLGEEVDVLLLSEGAQIRQIDWERVLRGRVTSRLGKVLVPTTPKGKNWVYNLWLRGQSQDYPNYASWLFPSSCNPYLDPEDIKDARSLLDIRVAAEQYGGQFISMTGNVYPDFGEANIKETFPDGSELPPPEWPVTRAVDFGYRNPFACLWIAHEPVKTTVKMKNKESGEMEETEIELERDWVFDEHYLAKTLLEEHAEIILEKSEPIAGQIECTYADCEAAQDIAELGEYLDDIIPTTKIDLETGIRWVTAKMRRKIDGVPLLNVLRFNINTIQNLEDYEWRDETRRVDDNPREKPKDKDNHACDCIRYDIVERTMADPGIMDVEYE